MHMHHQHPDQLNEERLKTLAAKRQLWSTEEDQELLECASWTWTTGMMKKDHLEALQTMCPRRSEDAIKKYLQLLKWTPQAGEETAKMKGATASVDTAMNSHGNTTLSTNQSPLLPSHPMDQLFPDASGGIVTLTLADVQQPPPIHASVVSTRDEKRHLTGGQRWSEQEDAIILHQAILSYTEGMLKKDLGWSSERTFTRKNSGCNPTASSSTGLDCKYSQ